MCRRLLTLPAVLAVAAAAALPSMGASETGSTVVTAEVLSATNLDVATACAGDVPDVTAFGQVMPGTDNVTGTDCTVGFGSSNDTSMLRVFQSDGAGDAFNAPTDGTLNLGFAGDGMAEIDFNTPGGDDFFGGGDLQEDGSVLVVGQDTAGDFILARVTAGGVLDTGFDGSGSYNGAVVIPATSGGYGIDVAVAPDGDYLVTGENAQANARCVIARTTAAGVLDAAFVGDSGTANGLIEIDLTAGDDRCQSITVESDGMITVAATGNTGGTGSSWLIRMHPDGTLDTGFNGSGILQLAVGANWDTVGSHDIDIDGDIWVGGTKYESAFCQDRWLAKVTSAGSIAASFNGGSIRIDNASCEEGINAVAARPVGGVAAAGLNTGVQTDSTIWVHTPTGALDADFNGGSFQENYGLNGDDLQAVAVTHDDMVVATGVSWSEDGQVIRLLDDGTLDPGFSDDGLDRVLTWGYGIDVNHGGAMVAMGGIDVAGEDHILLVMYQGFPVPDYDDAGGDDWSTADAGLFGACLIGASNAATNGTTWTIDTNDSADCLDGDADPWNAIPQTSGDAAAKLAESDGSGQTLAAAHLRFGFRVAPDAQPGTYAAPMTFEAVAPNV